jgi:hypothetical protein
MTNTERDRAHRHIETVTKLRAQLLAEYERPPTRPAVIAQLHQDIGAHMKLADIHAQLAVSEAVTDLGGDLFSALRARADRILDREAEVTRMDGTRVS